jgi:threonine dehydratase
MVQPLDLDEVLAARARIQPYVRHTPLAPLPMLRDAMPAGLRLKLENLQVSGSFKARGAFNNLLRASPEQRARGVVVASGGNHGLAIAYAASRLDMPATVFLPTYAAPDRERRIAAWGARVIRHGENSSELFQTAIAFAEMEEMLFVHPFDMETTLHGTGTLGLELLEDLPELDCVLIAIGGGGLIAGMAAAIKQHRPEVRVVGVEPTGAASMKHSLDLGKLEELPAVSTIADTLAPRIVSQRTLELSQAYVDEVVLVSDTEMVDGMRWLWSECNQLVEPAGAAVIAAIQRGAVDLSRYQAPVALICGGNADAESVFAAYAQAARD